MNRQMFKKLGNKGASLVLVIVCMLFVGIIAAAVLTLTVGNTNNLDTTENTSDTFYSAESVIDGLKAYLQKFANQAATKAYATTLEKVASDSTVDMETEFNKEFSINLKSLVADAMIDPDLNKLITDGNYSSAGVGTNASFKLDLENMEYMSNDVDPNGTLKNIRLLFTANDGYETQILTDIQINGVMPTIRWDASETQYEYDIDKYVVIAEQNIKSSAISGSITGSVYSGANVELAVSNTGLEVKSPLFISKGTVKMSGYTANFSGIDSDNFLYRPLKRNVVTNPTETKDAAIDNATPNGNLWINGFDINGGTTNVKGGALFMQDDLSMNGDNAVFKATDNAQIWGFSAESETNNDGTSKDTLSEHANSSAIVINGKNTTVDLNGADKIVLNGTAYIEVPEIAGAGSTNATYMVQGESITYRALQSVYLVPGRDILGVGHNPMTEAEAANITGIVNNTGVTLNASKTYKTANVRYVTGGDVYTYVYYNFASPADAISYFNTKYNSDEDFKKSILSKSGIFGSGAGVGIFLDPSKLVSRGNFITFDGSQTNPFGYSSSNWDNSMNSYCGTYAKNYKNYTTNLTDQDKPGTTDSVLQNMFVQDKAGVGMKLLTDTVGEDSIAIYPLTSPASWTSGDYTYTSKKIAANGQKVNLDTEYRLVIGKSFTIDSNSNCPNISSEGKIIKYIVIASGDVTVQSGTIFDGMIIANGNVTIGDDVTLNCLGNVYNEIKENSDIIMKQYISEFDALLSVIVDGDSNIGNGNTLLRKIFNVAGTGGNGAGASNSVSSMTNVDTVNWKKD